MSPEQQAAKLKAKYVDALASANNICAVAVTNNAWSPFKDQLHGINKAKEALEAKIGSNDFFAEYLIHEKGAIAKQRPSTFAQDCSHMQVELEPLISTLVRETAAIMDMKLARDRALAK